MRIGTLQGAVGAFCATMGTVMLVAPHQYRLPEYSTLKPYLPWPGYLLVVAGVGLLATAVLRPRRKTVVTTHLLGAGVLLGLAAGFVGGGIWTGLVNYAVLGLATGVAPFVTRPREAGRASGDLFALAVATGAVLNGILFLFVPDRFNTPFYDVPRPYLPWYGGLFLVGGLALTFAQIRPSLPPPAFRAAHLLLPVAYYAFGLPNLHRATWTGVAYYGGSGLLLALLPWLTTRLRHMEVASMQTRLALCLAAATAIPLIAIVAVGSEYNEQLATSQALASQQTRAGVLARQVSGLLDRHRATLAVLATQARLSDMEPGIQRGVLRSLEAIDPGAVGFATFDAAGREIARSGDAPLRLGDGARRFLSGRASPPSEPSVEVLEARLVQGPLLTYWLPTLDANGLIAGMVVAGIDVPHLIELLDRAYLEPGEKAFLVDGKGRLLAIRPDSSAFVTFADLSLVPPVAALLSGGGDSGSLRYAARDGEWLAGYARVPGLEWGTVVERSTDVAVAVARSERDLASWMLMLVIGLSLSVGATAAGLFVSPLRSLTQAMERLGSGDARAPLPRSGVTEVARLTAVFGEMRDHLEARTAERERAEEALRARERQQAAVAQLGQRALAGIEPDALMAEAAALIAQTLAAEIAKVQELLPDGRSLLLRAAVGLNEGQVGQVTVVAGPGAPADSLLFGSEPLIVEDISTETRFACPPVLQGYGVVSGVSVVIPGRNRPHGIVSAHTTRRRSFTQDDVHFLQTVAHVLAMAVQRRRTEESQRFLAEAGSLLASSLDYETTLAAVARLAVPHLADWCSVSVVEEDGSIRRLAAAHLDPAKEEFLHDLHRRFPLTCGASHPVAAVVRTGRSRVVAKVSESALVGKSHSPELVEMLRKVGIASMMLVPLPARGRILGAIMLVAAEPHRHYGEEELVLAEELARHCALAVDNARLYREAQEAVRARDEFLSVAAHELRTPVTSLRGFAQLSLRQLEREGDLNPAIVERAFQVIDRQSEKLSRLVFQLLDVSRIQAERLTLDRKRVDLAGLVGEVVATARATTTRHKLKLHAAGEVWASVDPLRLEQVVANLIDNAIKYSPAGGDIEVKLSAPDIEVVRLEVRDHGIGIPPEHRALIFDRFYRVDGGSPVAGMGLGLYISHHIVDLHGGRIVAESPPEGGTRFVVTLPAGTEGKPATTEGGNA